MENQTCCQNPRFWKQQKKNIYCYGIISMQNVVSDTAPVRIENWS